MTHTSDFEKEVIENLAILRTQMEALVGQDGRLNKTDRNISRLWAAVLGIGGAVVVLGGPKILQLLIYTMK